MEHAKQADAVAQDRHLELISVAHDAQAPPLLKKPAEQARQSAPWNPDEQTVHAAEEEH